VKVHKRGSKCIAALQATSPGRHFRLNDNVRQSTNRYDLCTFLNT
jgi:hypothetical protein